MRLPPDSSSASSSTQSWAESEQSLPSIARLDEALVRTRDWLLERQQPDGHWRGELEGDSILESEYILLLAFLGREQSPEAEQAARYLVEKQLPAGGWAMYPGGKLEISGSVKAYFALKLTGHDPSAEYMTRAKGAIRAAGGADAVNSFTRFYLALLGQISYDHCPAVPPEAVLLPAWFPLSIYQISAWSRTILVPLAIMWAHRPTRQLPDELGMDELFLRDPREWPELRAPGARESRAWWSWERFFRALDRTIKRLERWRIRPLRRRALRAAEKWMIERFDESDGLGAIFPPIVWSLVALKCLGYADDSPEVRECHAQLAALAITESGETGQTLRLEPCKSPVWDTAITLRALAGSGVSANNPAVTKAVDWLLDREVKRRGDWSAKVRAEPAGWYFEHRNEFYPDVDDTIMVLMALRNQFDFESHSPSNSLVSHTKTTTIGQAHLHSLRLDRVATACERGTNWVLAMQNKDGGWGAFDKDNDREFLCQVPFADHNAMIDPSTPDLAGRVLEALGKWGRRVGDKTVDRAVAYLRRTQESDGSWFGRWGVNYIYGTWQVLVGLAAVGVPLADPSMERGADWLLACQQPSGAWGESADSYDDPSLRGQGPATASQTSWALLGLLAAGNSDHPAVSRGVDWLLSTQRADGSWDEAEFTGTGFPRVFYLRYHYYRIYFPLLALGEYRSRTIV